MQNPEFQTIAITPTMAITGSCFELIQGNPLGANYHGFVRDIGSSYQTFDAATDPAVYKLLVSPSTLRARS